MMASQLQRTVGELVQKFIDEYDVLLRQWSGLFDECVERRRESDKQSNSANVNESAHAENDDCTRVRKVLEKA